MLGVKGSEGLYVFEVAVQIDYIYITAYHNDAGCEWDEVAYRLSYAIQNDGVHFMLAQEELNGALVPCEKEAVPQEVWDSQESVVESAWYMLNRLRDRL